MFGLRSLPAGLWHCRTAPHQGNAMGRPDGCGTPDRKARSVEDRRPRRPPPPALPDGTSWRTNNA